MVYNHCFISKVLFLPRDKRFFFTPIMISMIGNAAFMKVFLYRYSFCNIRNEITRQFIVPDLSRLPYAIVGLNILMGWISSKLFIRGIYKIKIYAAKDFIQIHFIFRKNTFFMNICILHSRLPK